MSSGNRRSRYHSFFSKRKQSKSPVNAGGRKNDPKKQHLSINAPRVSEDVKVEQQEVVNISGENLSDEVVALIASNHKNGSTYAEFVSKKKIVYKYLTYVQKGRERRDPITKALFLTFMSSLQSGIWKMPKPEFDRINIDWSDHHLGRGLIACTDEFTSRFIKERAEAFIFEGQTVRAWLKDEFGKTNIYQTFLHNEVWFDIRGAQALGWILEKNGLLGKGQFQVICYKRQRNGVFCRFEASDDLAMAIDAHGHSLRAGICRVVLKKKVITNNVALMNAETLAKDAEASADSAEKNSAENATKP